MVQKVQEIAEVIASDVIAGLLGPGDLVPTVRDLAKQQRCSPGTAARAQAILRNAGVIAGPPRSAAVVTADGVARALSMSAGEGTVRLAGSDDPALDVLLAAVGSVVTRAAGGRGSVAGLGLLAQGMADVAAVHLKDAHTGRSNDTFVRRLLGGRPAMLVHLWKREQGIVVPRANPMNIRGVEQLAGTRIAWRAPGTGSRLLLARLLRDAGVTPRPDAEPCDSHLGVAVAVATGAADAGLAVRAVAEAVDTEFLPVEWEDFELAIAQDSVMLLAPILAVLASTAVQDRLKQTAGYDLSRCGEFRVAA